MKPSKIFDVLNLAMKAREIGEIFNPLFVGPPGVGKSQIVQAWAKKNSLPFIDLRAAYLEAPDVIGFPSIEAVNQRQVTVHNIPEFWPYEGKGVLLLEEPNRGTTSIMNCFMQLLTDRKIHKYVLPEGWIIVGCINPDGLDYDVTTMDPALKDRFEIFDVSYDKVSFVDYMKGKEWDKSLVMFVESNSWSYVLPENVGNVPGSKYVSPRTMSKLNAALRAGMEDKEFELLVCTTILGRNIGRDFYNFRHNESPVVYSELKSEKKKALNRLKKFSDPANLKAGMITLTIQDIVEHGDIEDKLLAEVLEIIPVDQGTVLIRDLEFKRKDNTLLTRMCKEYPAIKDLFKTVLTYGKN